MAVLDLGTIQTVGHTYAFDEQVAWLATQCSESAFRKRGDRLAHRGCDHHPGLGRRREAPRPVRRPAADRIDETSYKRDQRYLTVVVDHDSSRLVWAAPGREKATLERFFDALGEQPALITHVSADDADSISAVVTRRCPNAARCAAPFHVVKWATDALGEVRRQAWNTAPPVARSRSVAPAARPGTPRHSSTPATRCGRAPRTSPAATSVGSWKTRRRPSLSR